MALIRIPNGWIDSIKGDSLAQVVFYVLYFVYNLSEPFRNSQLVKCFLSSIKCSLSSVCFFLTFFYIYKVFSLFCEVKGPGSSLKLEQR